MEQHVQDAWSGDMMKDNLEGWEEVKERIDSMDADQLRLSAMMMVLRLGTAESLAALRDAEVLMHDGEGPVCAPAYEEIHRTVKGALSSAACDIDADFDHQIYDDEIDHEDLMESLWAHEYIMICENIRDEFGDLVQDILELGSEEEAQKCIERIVNALLDRDIPWENTSEEAMEYRKAYTEAIWERFRNKEYETLFEEFDYDETA